MNGLDHNYNATTLSLNKKEELYQVSNRHSFLNPIVEIVEDKELLDCLWSKEENYYNRDTFSYYKFDHWDLLRICVQDGQDISTNTYDLIHRSLLLA